MSQIASPRPIVTPELQAIFDEIAKESARRDAERIHPFDVLDRLRSARFGALRFPLEEGGYGASWRETLGAVVALAEADPNVAHIYRNHFHVAERFLTGREEGFQRRWREAVLRGEIIGLATTELSRSKTGGGGGFDTVLTPDGDGYRLNGTKFYSTGALYADWVLVRVSHDGQSDDVPVILPGERAGMERIDDWDGIGQKVTGSGTTNFRDVRVERDEVVRDPRSFVLPLASTIAQIFLTAVNAGILRAVLRDAKSLLHGRSRNFYFAPAPIAAQDPILQETIGRIAAESFAAELCVLAAGDALDTVAGARDGGADPELVLSFAHDAAIAAAKAKVVVDGFVLRAGNAIFEVAGASAVTARKNVDRHWRNARTVASHNPGAYKALALGALELHGTKLPQQGFF